MLLNELRFKDRLLLVVSLWNREVFSSFPNRESLVSRSPRRSARASMNCLQIKALADAIRDFSEDQGTSFNPLCIETGPKIQTLPAALKNNVLGYIGTHLKEASNLIDQAEEGLKLSWHAVERSLLAAAGVSDQKSITLYSSCCIPCGNGAVVVDSEECSQAITGCACCAICCCLFCKYA